MDEHPLRIVNAAAPVRICDIGGWTDTWFAEHGRVFNIGVHPGVEVQIKVHPVGAMPRRVVLDLQNYGECYAFDLGTRPGHHTLLETAIDEMRLPDDVSVEISVYSEMPAGSSTGTSASTTVALIGALDALTPGCLSPHELAYLAHRLETERLGIQSGIQDQLCAALGGVNFIQISPYPHASVTRLNIPGATLSELERRLALVSLGRPHVSSALHDQVIARLAFEGPNALPLCQLRRAAESARVALLEGDFRALGQAMTRNTDAQRQLHPDLVSADAELAIEVATLTRAVGWKVNGAGGDGGSLTVLCENDIGDKPELRRSLLEVNPHFQIVPTYLDSHGLRVWESQP